MIDEKELGLWISRLETEESSWPNYEKLAALYTIRDACTKPGKKPREVTRMYSAAPAAEPYGDSEFLQAVYRAGDERAWEVMNDLMDSLKVINARIYNSVMHKLE